MPTAENITGVLLDISGIQKYVFGTNRLRQNAGASFIVEDVMSRGYLKHFTGLSDVDFDAWWKEPKKCRMLDSGASAEIAYIGGGNALILFAEMESARTFCRQWSLELLSEYPGLKPVIGIYEGQLDTENFSEFIGACRNDLFRSRSSYHPQRDLPRHGFTAECIYTGGSAQYHGPITGKNATGSFYSQEAFVKENAAEESQKLLGRDYKEALKGSRFSLDFTEIGASCRPTSIAVVHIDGNDMGKMFKDQKTLAGFRRLSTTVSLLVGDAASRLVADINTYADSNGVGEGDLPFRPIIIGGDDITYVVRGDLGVWSAARFLYHIDALQDGDDKITACAGVAVVKPSYPFSQSYEMALELCESGKEKSRSVNLSYLDFHVHKGGTWSSLGAYRESAYRVDGKSLVGRPFALGKGQEGYARLVNALEQLYVADMPNNKLKEMREVLYKSAGELEIFKQHLKYRDIELPKIKLDGKREGLGKYTYMDLLELIEIYPKALIAADMEDKEAQR